MVNAWYNRGYCFLMIGRSQEAMDDFNKVIELEPRNYKAFFWLGSIYEHEKDYGSALANFEQALRLNPGWRDAENGVREMKQKIGKN